eukprot:gene22028-29089_t
MQSTRATGQVSYIRSANANGGQSRFLIECALECTIRSFVAGQRERGAGAGAGQRTPRGVGTLSNQLLGRPTKSEDCAAEDPRSLSPAEPIASQDEDFDGFQGYQGQGNTPGGESMDQQQAQYLTANTLGGRNGHQSTDALSDPETREVLHRCQQQVHGNLSDVAGLEKVKGEMRDAIFLPLAVPHLFYGLRQTPKTFLLVGPPGTGKTLLVEKIAAEAGMVLLALSPSSVLSKWSGESERFVKSAFVAASAMQPCIIFIDEIDSLGGQRGAANEDPSSRRLLTELLIQMSRVSELRGVFTFACTNRIQDCDPALLRRFERRILVPLPNAQDRTSYFAQALQRPEMEHSITNDQLELIVQLTESYSFSDLACICKEAALTPVRELMSSVCYGSKSSFQPYCGLESLGRCRVVKHEAGTCSTAAVHEGKHPVIKNSASNPMAAKIATEATPGAATADPASRNSRKAMQTTPSGGLSVGNGNCKRIRNSRGHTTANSPPASNFVDTAACVHKTVEDKETPDQPASLESSNKIRRLALQDFTEAIAKIAPAIADHASLGVP